MKQLYSIYELDISDTRHRRKLKTQIKNHFKDEVLFFSPTRSPVSLCHNREYISYQMEDTLNLAESIY